MLDSWLCWDVSQPRDTCSGYMVAELPGAFCVPSTDTATTLGTGDMPAALKKLATSYVGVKPPPYSRMPMT